MNKGDFIGELRKKLRGLPGKEIDNAIEYYLDYFEDAGEENEQEVIKELGSPNLVASQILADYAVKEHENEHKPSKKGISAVWFIILAVFASPIALPLAFALVMMILAAFFVIAVMIAAFFVVLVSLVVSGLAMIILGCVLLGQDVTTAIMYMGTGFLASGFGLLLTMPYIQFTKKGFYLIARGTSKLLKKLKFRRVKGKEGK